MATNYNKLMNNLEMLKLDKIREYLDSYISLVNEGQKDIVDAFYELTSFEMDLRNERAMNACVKVANFPYIKTFEDFDFSYQPSINKDEIIDFRNLRFMEYSAYRNTRGRQDPSSNIYRDRSSQKQKQHILH